MASGFRRVIGSCCGRFAQTKTRVWNVALRQMALDQDVGGKAASTSSPLPGEFPRSVQTPAELKTLASLESALTPAVLFWMMDKVPQNITGSQIEFLRNAPLTCDQWLFHALRVTRVTTLIMVHPASLFNTRFCGSQSQNTLSV